MAAIPVKHIEDARKALEAVGDAARTEVGWEETRSSLERLEQGLAADDDAEFCKAIGELELLNTPGGRLGGIREANPDEPKVEPPRPVETFRNRLIADLDSRAEQGPGESPPGR